MSGDWSLTHGGHTFWRVARADTAKLAVSLIDVNPGTFSSGLIVKIYAKEAIAASTSVVALSIFYQPLVPVDFKYAHMVFGGFSATHVQSKPLGSIRFFHMGDGGALQTDVVDDALTTATSQIAQKITPPTTYIQWISPFFTRMEMRLETSSASGFAAGDHVATVLLGDFGQPNVVQARRFGTMRATVGGKNVVVGYRVAKQTDATKDALALAPSYDALSMHASNSKAAGWTRDAAYASLAIQGTHLFTYDFWGIFFYNVLDSSDKNIELFKVMVADLSAEEGGRNIARYYTVMLSANGADPRPMTAYAPGDAPIAGTDWHSTIKSDALYQNGATNINIGPLSSNADIANSFVILPWRTGTGRIAQNAEDIREATPSKHHITPANKRFDIGIVGSRYGDMFGVMMSRTEQSTTAETQSKIQILPYTFNQVGAILKFAASSAADATVVDVSFALAGHTDFGSIASHFHLNVTALPATAAQYTRSCQLPGHRQAIRLGRISGGWTAQGASPPPTLVSIADTTDLESSAAFFAVDKTLALSADGKTVSCGSSELPAHSPLTAFSRTLRACVVHYGNNTSIPAFKYVNKAGQQVAFPDASFQQFFSTGKNAFAANSTSRCGGGASATDPSCCPEGQTRSPESGACECPSSTHVMRGNVCTAQCSRRDAGGLCSACIPGYTPAGTACTQDKKMSTLEIVGIVVAIIFLLCVAGFLLHKLFSTDGTKSSGDDGTLVATVL